MALPSQSARNTRYRARSSRGMRRRRRGGGGGGKKAFALLVFVGIVVAGWWLWSRDPGEKPSDGDGTQLASNNDERGGAVEPRVNTNAGEDRSRSTITRTIPPKPQDDEISKPTERTSDDPPRELRLTDTDDQARGAPVQQPDPEPAKALPNPVKSDGTSNALTQIVSTGLDAYNRGSLILARDLWNRALHHQLASESEREALRERLAEISDRLIFSREIRTDDPLTGEYVVAPNNSLGGIVSKQKLKVDYLLIARLNEIADPSKIRVGQRLKTIQGPFHAVISKSEYRLDLYADITDADGNWLYIRSWPVGLGEDNITPVGEWRVIASRRLIDPEWVNPRTGERFESSDEDNPIGERWIPLKGMDEVTKRLDGYGIHGTIDFDSIGKQRSMGCVRLLPDDVEMVYEFLASDDCRVIITP